MATRKRKAVVKKLPAFKLTRIADDAEENDLKKVKAKAIKDLEEQQKISKEWLDNELEKNLKNSK